MLIDSMHSTKPMANNPINSGRLQKLNTSVRVTSAEETLRKISPFLDDFGIKTLTDISLEGVPSCPVFQVTRHDMRSDYFNIGKGYTEVESKVSGLMEAIEVQCYELASPELLIFEEKLSVPSDHKTLLSAEPLNSSTHDVKVLGFDLISNEEIHVDADEVFLEVTAGCQTEASPNGIASGNTFEESSCHALYEMVERDALQRFFDSKTESAIERVLPPEDAEQIHQCLDELASIDIKAEFVSIESKAGVSVFICFLDMACGEGVRGASQGFGAHHNPLVSMARALAEAIQIVAVSPKDDDRQSIGVSDAVTITSKQMSELNPAAIYEHRILGYQMLSRIRVATPEVEFDFMDVDDDVIDSIETFQVETAESLLNMIVERLRLDGFDRIISCDIGQPDLPVKVVKCFCDGLQSVRGL